MSLLQILTLPVAVGLLLATGTLAQPDINQYTCPEGYVTFQFYPIGSSPGVVSCFPDPCYKDACGAGNTCTVIYQAPVPGPSPGSSAPSSVARQCTCKAPTTSVSYAGLSQYCTVPSSDPCNPNPCNNGGQCLPGKDALNAGPQGTHYCQCPLPLALVGLNCDIPINTTLGVNPFPTPTLKPQGVCGSGDATPFPIRCYFNNDPQGRYVCCDVSGCNGFNPPDYKFPHCSANGFVPPGFGVGATPPGSNPPAPATPGPTPPVATPPVAPTPAPTSPATAPPTGSQGVCGTGAAGDFPTRCYFNNDPQGRYVCCDTAGCNGFASLDNSFPRCQANGYAPPGYGVNAPPMTSPPCGNPPTTGDQGVCGTGAAGAFPVRCYYNNDPQGRYVCCDKDGCDGFNPPGNFFPHCKTNGYVPPGM